MENKIGISTKKFIQFLNEPENDRILFSGKFGSGKTTFLKDCFKADHKVVHIYPVNYSIASNQDIFDLIKYDILLELVNPTIERNITFEKNEFSKLFNLQYFIFKKFNSITYSLLELIPKIGKDLKTYLEVLNDNLKEFEEQCKYSELELLQKFTEEIENNSKGVYESDLITLLIRKYIDLLGKDTILIIDDLDRIDPDHIFRILNVFAAHIDIENNHNKFGFDKIIFVGDVANLKSIYHHRFGENTDFNGYINKFFSKRVYTFDLIKEVLSNFSRLFGKIAEEYNDYDIGDVLVSRSDEKRDYLQNILFNGLRNGLFQIRELTKNFKENEQTFKYPNNSFFTKYDVFFFKLLVFIKAIKGSLEGLDAFMENLCSDKKHFEVYSLKETEFVRDIFFILCYDFGKNKVTKFKFTENSEEYNIHIEVNNIKIRNSGMGLEVDSFLNFISFEQLVYEAYKKIRPFLEN
jgi:hypothetical protein